MNAKHLLEKLAAILDDDHHAQVEKHKSLKKVLKGLRSQKIELQDALEETRDPDERDEIESRLKIITAQRSKGLNLLKKLQKERSSKT